MKSKRNKIIEKTINLLLNVLIFVFGIILLISIYTSVQTKILDNDYANFFGYSIFEVQTGSMADTINAGDWIIVKLKQKVKLNDVIVYELNGEYITHRIIEVYNDTYITKGDANNAKDTPINQNKIVGKVVSVLANLGIFRKILFNPSVLIALIATLFLFNLAFKKNEVENTKTKTTKFNMGGNKYLSFDVIVERINLFLDILVKNISVFFEIIMKSTNNKKLKRVENNRYEADELNETLFYRNISFEVDDRFKELSKKIENDESKEEELDKTILYRVIPVDAVEVDDKFKDSISEIEYNESEDDELDKTTFFRMISVDATEVDDTLLEIAENEIKEAAKNDKNKKKEMDLEINKEKENDVEDAETLTKINLDLLDNKKSDKKGKNIIDTAMLIKKEELNELINILILDEKNYVNKATIKNIFINTYIDAKYYNYYDDKDMENRRGSSIFKVKKAIKEVANKLIKSYRGNDAKYTDIVYIYTNIFTLIANLEQARDSITDLKAKNEFYKKEIIKYYKDWDNQKIEYVINEIIKIQKNYAGILDYFMEKLETNMFNLSLNKLTTKKNMYGLELGHNISFSKVYSDYIIDKTYTEGIIAEDKLSVLLTLLSVQLIKDMISSKFDKKYIIYIPKSLYMKEKKLERLLKIIDDKYAKDNIMILITFEDLLKNKKIAKKVRKNGYKFALAFDKETVIKEKDRGSIYIADYIFINKKIVNIEKIISFISKELLDNVIYEDIINKVGDFGSE